MRRGAQQDKYMLDPFCGDLYPWGGWGALGNRMCLIAGGENLSLWLPGAGSEGSTFFYLSAQRLSFAWLVCLATLCSPLLLLILGGWGGVIHDGGYNRETVVPMVPLAPPRWQYWNQKINQYGGCQFVLFLFVLFVFFWSGPTCK